MPARSVVAQDRHRGRAEKLRKSPPRGEAPPKKRVGAPKAAAVFVKSFFLLEVRVEAGNARKGSMSIYFYM